MQARGRAGGEKPQVESVDADRACSRTPVSHGPPHLACGAVPSPGLASPLSPAIWRLPSPPGSVELSTSPLASQLTCASPFSDGHVSAVSQLVRCNLLSSFCVYGTFRTRTVNPDEASWREGG